MKDKFRRILADMFYRLYSTFSDEGQGDWLDGNSRPEDPPLKGPSVVEPDEETGVL
jgi:hypothetical protein